jgi:predicted anti-sigma-YlaC factor YlaD
MSEHILEQLGAYLDGELQGRQLHKVEAHLAECETCRMELDTLRSLSGMLQTVPILEFPQPERFASNVNLQLTRKPEVPLHRKALEFGWWLVPVGLLVAWIFVNTTILISNAVSAAGEIGMLNDHSAWLTAGMEEADWSAALGQFGLLSGNSLQWAEKTEAFTRTTVPEIVWQVSIALLYLCWLAIWWVRRTNEEHGQLPGNGSWPTVK